MDQVKYVRLMNPCALKELLSLKIVMRITLHIVYITPRRGSCLDYIGSDGLVVDVKVNAMRDQGN